MLDAEDLPGVAAAAIEEGIDTRSFHVLAGLSGLGISEARSWFDRGLAEIRYEVPSARRSVIFLAQQVATDILSGRVTPIQGASSIWDLSVAVPGLHLPELDTFVYAASEWDDRPRDRLTFELGIEEAARDLAQAAE